MTGPRISDMTPLAVLPASGAYVPVVKNGETTNYLYDLTNGIGEESLFINASTQTIPTTFNIVASTGYSTLGVGSALYVADAAVNSAYVTAHPRSSFVSANGRGFRISLEQNITPQMLGAAGDGTTNDWGAISAAVVLVRGAKLRFPKANYLIDTDGGSITLEEVDLTGECVLDGATGTIDEGAMLWITGTANSPFKVRRGVSVEGLGIYYPNQTDSASPTAYPSTFVFDFTNGPVQFVSIHRNVVYNAYKFIESGDTGGNIGHIEISDNYICALNRAIYLRNNAEHFRVERNNFTFGIWLAATEAGAAGYIRANATAFQVEQSDGIEFSDNLVFGHLNGVLGAGTDLCQMMNVTDNDFDQVRYGVRAVGTGNFSGKINGNTFNAFNSQDHSLQGRSISIETTGNLALEAIAIVGNNFNLATEEHIYVTGDVPTRDINVGVNTWISWAGYKISGLYGAINCNGALTNLQVTGGKINGGSNAAHSKGIVGTLNTLQMTGATFDQTVAPLDVTASFCQSSANRSFSTSGATSDIVVTGSGDYFNGLNAWDKPSSKVVTVSTGTVTYARRYETVIFTVACTLTLPSADSYAGPGIRVVTQGANAIISASSNIIPITGGAAGTAILAASAGKWAVLVPNGTNWQIASAN